MSSLRWLSLMRHVIFLYAAVSCIAGSAGAQSGISSTESGSTNLADQASNSNPFQSAAFSNRDGADTSLSPLVAGKSQVVDTVEETADFSVTSPTTSGTELRLISELVSTHRLATIFHTSRGVATSRLAEEYTSQSVSPCLSNISSWTTSSLAA
jgi:hypothetical protein